MFEYREESRDAGCRDYRCGAAGLGAAKVAISKRLSIKVLEAASYRRGRARTDTQRLGVPFDLGKMYILH
jgi:predicted NAD/FAD-binding protein